MRFSHLFFIAGTLLLMGCASSCSNKEGAALYEGNYSFKTSGSLNVEKKLSDDESADTSEKTLYLTAESGQMTIVKDGKNQVIITMNIIGSDILVLKGEVDDQTLVITQAKRALTVHDGTASVDFNCNVSGQARKYDDLIIFTLTYGGSGTSSLHDYTITSSEVNCVAKLNK